MGFVKGNLYVAKYDGEAMYVQCIGDNTFVGFGSNERYELEMFEHIRPLVSNESFRQYAIIVDEDVNLSGNTRGQLESVEDEYFDDISQLKQSLGIDDDELGTGDVKILPLSDFMDEYNNDEIKSSVTWFGYVWIKR